MSVRFVMVAVVTLLAGCSDETGGLPVNSTCSNNQDCADRVCHAGVCASATPVEEGSACSGNGDCKSFNCLGGVCRSGKLPDGEGCIRGEECVSGTCNQLGKCGALKQDAAPPDAGAPDLLRPDQLRADQAPPDRALPDATIPDAAQPDMALPDKALPDKAVPDQLQPDASLCGNGKLDPSEICDGALLGGKTCKTQGFTAGALKCKACQLDTFLCHEVRDPANIQIGTHGTHHTRWPRVASDGSKFLAVWHGSSVGGGDESTWIHGAILDGNGKSGGLLKVVDTAPGKKFPELIFTGKDYLLVWKQGYGISGTPVTAAGKAVNPVGASLATYYQGVQVPGLSFDGTNLLLTYAFGADAYNVTHQVWGQRVTTAGAKQGAAFQITSGSFKWKNDTVLARPAFDGQNHLVAWSDGNNLLARRVTPAGKLVETKPFTLSSAAGAQVWPALARGHNAALVAWEDTQGGGREINGTVVGQTGTGPFTHKWVAVSSKAKYAPAVAYDGKSWLVVYNPTPHIIRAMRVDSAGGTVDPAVITLTSSKAFGVLRPSVAWNGKQYLVVWQDSRGGKRIEIRGTRLRFGKSP